MQRKLQMYSFSKHGRVFVVIEAESRAHAIARAGVISHIHHTPGECRIYPVERGYFPNTAVFFDPMLRTWEALMKEIETA
jgi:hypothetical protein